MTRVPCSTWDVWVITRVVPSRCLRAHFGKVMVSLPQQARAALSSQKAYSSLHGILGFWLFEEYRDISGWCKYLVVCSLQIIFIYPPRVFWSALGYLASCLDSPFGCKAIFGPKKYPRGYFSLVLYLSVPYPRFLPNLHRVSSSMSPLYRLATGLGVSFCRRHVLTHHSRGILARAIMTLAPHGTLDPWNLATNLGPLGTNRSRDITFHTRVCWR